MERARTDFPDDSSRLREVRTPTLVLWGEADAWIPVEHARRFAADVPGARVAVYAGAGHVPMEEIPEPTVAEARRFFEAHALQKQSP